MVTVRQIAQEAGVSIGTVSRALNNKSGVSEGTRQRILAVAQELSYVPSKRLPFPAPTVTHLGLLARPMRQDVRANPFYSDVFHGVERICRETRINLSFSSLDIVDGRLHSLPALVNDERLSGIILVGALPQAVIESVVASARLPIVLVDNYFPRCAWDAVIIDNTRGMYLATELLIARGHRHIALISGPDHPSIVERREGYEEALRRHNLTPTIVTTADLEPRDGELAVVQLLKQAPETTAIVCSNDSQAIGALRKLQESGYRVPDDFSLVGFDDINWAQFTSPPLTTVRVDRYALGWVAVQLLLGCINTPERPAVKSIVDVTLVERASVCHPRPHRVIHST